MNDIVVINDWLKNPNRSFADGITIRNKYKINNKMDAFFANANPNAPNGVEIGMLQQEITKIHIKLINNPKLIEVKAVQESERGIVINTSKTPTQSRRVKIESDKVKESDLPEELKPVFARIQEISPLLGAKHANLKAETDEAKSQVQAEEVVALDAEKRELWAKIDAFFKSQNMNLIVNQEETAQEPEVLSPFDKIMKIEDVQARLVAIDKREKMVTDDIARSKIKLEEFKKTKPKFVPQKEQAIAEKELEVKKLQDARAAIEGDK
jgi:hypothetical protein